MIPIQQSLFPSEDITDIVEDSAVRYPSRSHSIQQAIDDLGKAEAEDRGTIFTKSEIVNFILDLSGYTIEQDLSAASLLEPSFGSGNFLLIALERLLDSFFLHKNTVSEIVPILKDALKAVELNKELFTSTKEQMLRSLQRRNIPDHSVEELLDSWLIQDDFLLTPLPTHFTHIVGNPPYLRQERIPGTLITHYRGLYQTIYDRADLYIPFLERSLSLLAPMGRLSFICPDRWMKNKYGGPLRKLISDRFHVQAYVDMVGTDAFKSEVSAYPAIVLLKAEQRSDTYIARTPTIETGYLEKLSIALRNQSVSQDLRITVSTNLVDGNNPWLLGTTTEIALLRRLEASYQLLENSGCKVGIGVATGCDSVYIGQVETLPIEADRKLPLVMVSDLQKGTLTWKERYLANPFDAEGKLIHLDHYPLFAHYLSINEQKIKDRNVAKRNPTAWFRTIDKVNPTLMNQPKLLIPDIQGEPTVVFDEGHYYPHHNLYYITSTTWDLRALQAVLQSPIARLFVSSYCVKIRGGYLRFQAQYIRRICLPDWEQITLTLRERLINAVVKQDREACNEAVFELYQLSPEEKALLQK